jgi:SAM-dependent methyltransferase
MAADSSTDTGRLQSLYREMTSLDGIFKVLAKAGVDVDHLQARDLYERSLDCQNLGAYDMLLVVASVVADYAAPRPEDVVLDVGCGMGGPGRFVVDRFGCSVLGVDLLPLRIEAAEVLTERTGLADRISYRIAPATQLPADDASLSQVWMLDVGIHVHDKGALFAEIARVLRPGGLFVMHDQTGPLPRAMEPATRGAPFIAPSLAELVDYVEGAGLRALRWQDSTSSVIDYFRRIDERIERSESTQPGRSRPWREYVAVSAAAYITTLAHLGGRTGVLIAERREIAGPAVS